MNRSFLLSLSFFLLAQPSSVLGVGLYNVDLLGDLFPGQGDLHRLHVMGTIEVNTVTDEVIDSHLRFEHIQGFGIDNVEIYAADLPRLPQIGGAGIDFIDSESATQARCPSAYSVSPPTGGTTLECRIVPLGGRV